MTTSALTDDLPAPDRFMKATTNIIQAATKVAKGKHARLAACSVSAPLLLAQGNAEGRFGWNNSAIV